MTLVRLLPTILVSALMLAGWNASADKLPYGKQLLVLQQEAESVCSSDPKSPLSQIQVTNPGSVLEIFCEISFHLLPLYEKKLSLFEQSSRRELSQSLALAIVSLDTGNFNSVGLLLLEAYKMQPHPGLQKLLDNIILLYSPMLQEQKDHKASVEFLNATMVWGTTFLFAYRGIPWVYGKIPGAPKISLGKGPTPAPRPGLASAATGSTQMILLPSNSGKELILRAITEIKSPRWYHYYAAGGVAALIDAGVHTAQRKLIDLPALREHIEVDILCEASVTVAKMAGGEIELTKAQFQSVKRQLSRFSESGQNKYANFYPEKQLDDFEMMRYEEEHIWWNLFTYYRDHWHECQQLSVPATVSLMQTLEQGFQIPEEKAGDE